MLKALLLKSSYHEASEMVLRLIGAGQKLRINPQPLARVAKWLADNEQYGEAHDVYRFIQGRTPKKSNINDVSGKWIAGNTLRRSEFGSLAGHRAIQFSNQVCAEFLSNFLTLLASCLGWW